MKDLNSGYVGYSMSKRAADAHSSGERPLSQWTKEDIISSYPDGYRGRLSKLSHSLLKEYLLAPKGWHHTSKYLNKTDFFGTVDEDDLESSIKAAEREKEDRERYIKGKREFSKLDEAGRRKIYDEWNSKRKEGAERLIGYVRGKENNPAYTTEYDGISEMPGTRFQMDLDRDIFGREIPEMRDYSKYFEIPDYFEPGKVKTYQINRKTVYKE